MKTKKQNEKIPFHMGKTDVGYLFFKEKG